MKKFTRILIALDYSPASQKIAEIGYKLAQSMDSEVILLHVLSNPAYYASTVYNPIMGFAGFANLNLMESTLLDNLKKTAMLFLEKTRHYLGNETIDAVVEEGDSTDAILEISKEKNVDIIVMGSHSKNWLEHALLGSTAEDVLRKSIKPLFIIPIKSK